MCCDGICHCRKATRNYICTWTDNQWSYDSVGRMATWLGERDQVNVENDGAGVCHPAKSRLKQYPATYKY